jgi:hypothetical protein
MSETIDKATIEARMLSGKPFTYMELCKTHSKDNDNDRLIDRTIQRLRRAGKIYMTREGRYVVWRVKT